MMENNRELVTLQVKSLLEGRNEDPSMRMNWGCGTCCCCPQGTCCR